MSQHQVPSLTTQSGLPRLIRSLHVLRWLFNREENWTQHTLYRDSSGLAFSDHFGEPWSPQHAEHRHQACLLGGILVVERCANPIQIAIELANGIERWGLPLWNDQVNRSFMEIQTAIDKTIEAETLYWINEGVDYKAGFTNRVRAAGYVYYPEDIE